MSAALRSLSCLLLSSCSPDRFYVEGSHGWGSLDPSDKVGNYDVEGDAVTVGLSFPLQSPQERVVVERYLMGPPAPASLTVQPIAPVGAPDDGGGIPWETLILLLGGAAGWEGTRRGAPAIQRRLKKTTKAT